jgi:hypothetical protein
MKRKWLVTVESGKNTSRSESGSHASATKAVEKSKVPDEMKAASFQEGLGRLKVEAEDGCKQGIMRFCCSEWWLF